MVVGLVRHCGLLLAAFLTRSIAPHYEGWSPQVCEHPSTLVHPQLVPGTNQNYLSSHSDISTLQYLSVGQIGAGGTVGQIGAGYDHPVYCLLCHDHTVDLVAVCLASQY